MRTKNLDIPSGFYYLKISGKTSVDQKHKTRQQIKKFYQKTYQKNHSDYFPLVHWNLIQNQKTSTTIHEQAILYYWLYASIIVLYFGT